MFFLLLFYALNHSKNWNVFHVCILLAVWISSFEMVVETVWYSMLKPETVNTHKTKISRLEYVSANFPLPFQYNMPNIIIPTILVVFFGLALHSIFMWKKNHTLAHTHNAGHCKLLLIKIACGNACIQYRATKGVNLCILALPHSIHLTPLTLCLNTISLSIFCLCGNWCSASYVHRDTYIHDLHIASYI